jgi:prolyl oligopeptidase PreP (S9A serine peptidase family)
LDLYEALNEVLNFYNNESYFEKQLEIYELVKNDNEQFNTWLEYHRADKKYMYERFVTLFSDNATVTGFNLTILYPLSLPVKVKLDASEFQYTLKFLEILERSSKSELVGVIEIIKPIETVRLNEFQTYNKQTIIVLVNDTQNRLHIKFIKGKIEMLDKLKIGQKVKVYGDLIKREVKTDIQHYLGWKIELITN